MLYIITIETNSKAVVGEVFQSLSSCKEEWASVKIESKEEETSM